MAACNTNDRTFFLFCVRESHILTVTMTETALPRNVHAPSDDGASGASYCNSTANINADAGATSISGPLHCNSRTVDLALLGYRNFTTLGCAKPLEPHRYKDGVVSVSLPSFRMGVHPM